MPCNLRLCNQSRPWERRHGGQRHRFLFEFLFEVLYARLKLRVFALERGVWKIVDQHIGLDAMSFDQPGAVAVEDAEFGRRGDAPVQQVIAGGEPDFAAPGSCANDLSKL